MKKILLLITIIVLVTLCACRTENNVNGMHVLENTKETITIGVIVPLTGDLAFIGTGMQKAILMAENDLQNTRYEYEFIFEDDKFDPKEAGTAAIKLITMDKVDALISFASSTGAVVSGIANEHSIVHMCLASESDIAQGSYNYIHWTTPQEEARVFVEELERRTIRTLAIIHNAHPGSKAIYDAVDEELQSSAVHVVQDHSFNPGTKDFKSLLLKVQSSKADAILIVTASPELEILGKQIKELGISTPLTAIESFEYTQQPELFTGSWYVQSAEPNEEFKQSYETMYAELPSVGAANAYDSVNLLVYAFEQAAQKNAYNVAAQLNAIENFSGAVGSLTMAKEGIVQSMAIVKYVN